MDDTKIRLTEQQADCVLYIQQQYMLDGMVPSAEKICEVFGVTRATAVKWLASDEFDYLLRKEGIITGRIGRPEGVLTAQQLMIANYLLNISDRRSEREKCEAAHITPQQLAVWKKDPTFNDYIQKRAEALFHESADVAYMSVIKNMKGGDMTATKLYLEMTRRYQPSMRHDVNLNSFMEMMIEILQRRIPDTELLEVIANDIDNLMQGKPIEFDQQPMAAISATSVEEPIPVMPQPVPAPVIAPTPERFEIKLNLG
jgi:hypothetical protein